jgi:hypothetical protein
MEREDLKTVLDNLCLQYKDNAYALNRITYYINNLSVYLINDLNNYEKRMMRTNELTIEYDIFCNVFLSKHKYYYLPNNNCYYEYNNKTYKIIKEDDIHYNLLSTITEEGKLVQWKHKTKLHIIKLIKDRHLFKSIPETYTIQTILGFLQSTLFPSKNACKYFLTILGDNLLKKNTNCLYFVNSNIKKFLQLIDELSYITFGSSITNNFLSKHHGSHVLNNYRLIKTKEMQISYDVVKDMLNKLGMDLLCVASHYSDRFQNAECFLRDIKDKNFTKYVLYLSKNNIDYIINNFVDQCFIDCKENENSFSISWKNMHYIWKLHLSSIQIPNMIYSNNLKEILKSKLTYNEENDLFLNLTSKYLPQISSFLQFWDTYIKIENNSEVSFNEYEIGELITLFKSVNNTSINENDMLKFIKHFSESCISILDDKYINNISCSLWNKGKDIELSLNIYKEIFKNTHDLDLDLDLDLDSSNVNVLISFDQLYEHYRSCCQQNIYQNMPHCLIVSKQYFEKYTSNYLKDYLEFDNFISYNWVYSY